MNLSKSPQPAGASSAGPSRTARCLASASGSSRLEGLGIPSRPTSWPLHCAGNHEPPEGQWEHQPPDLTFTGLSYSRLADRMAARVEAMGVTRGRLVVALPPPGKQLR